MIGHPLRVGWRARATIAVAATVAVAQNPYPDLLYFPFDEGAGSTTANVANPGVGNLSPTVNGHTLSPAGGQFGGSLLGAGGNGTTSNVDTGWPTNLPGDWTISMWLDLTAVVGTNPFMYLFGDSSAGSFRCFTNGAAGANGIVLRSGQMTGIIIPGGANPAAPHHVAWTYVASTREMRGYLDGALVASAIQNPNTILGTGSFKVGTYATTTAMALDARLDEFRMYSAALTDQEIAATWNVDLNNTGPQLYCTAGTTTNGCVPAMSATGTPSASAPTGFTLSVASVEGQKQGLFFYGIDNSGFSPSPWGQGTSFLCVKAPTQRSPAQLSNGTAGACDGALSIDWNAYITANPGALGQPFSAGQHVFAQAWFRDPPAPKTTNLSDAVEFVVGP